MTEIMPYRQQRDVVDGWVQMLPAVGDLAVKISGTEFVSAQLRGKPAAIAAAILAGRELGLAPIQSLTHVAIVQGRPSLSAEMCRALVVAAGHELDFPERNNTRCVIRGRRRGSEDWTTITFSMDDARRAHLDGKDIWRKYPRRMLDARATSEICHLIFPDVVGGIAVSEEMEDLDDRPALDNGQAAEEPKRTAQRKPRPQALSGAPPQAGAPSPQRPLQAQQPPPQARPIPEDAPPLPGEDGYETTYVRQAAHPVVAEEAVEVEAEAVPPPAPPSDEQTAKQSRLLHTLFSKHRVPGRTAEEKAGRRHLAGLIVGRDLASTKDMSKQEISTLIDTLDRLPAVDGEDFTDLINRIAMANLGPILDDDQNIDPETGEILPPNVGHDIPSLDEETL